MFSKFKYKINNTFIDLNAIRSTATPERCALYTIPVKFDGRPDLIAYALYNDVSMQDYLTIINNIKDCPGGYTAGIVIKVLKPAYKDLVC